MPITLPFVPLISEGDTDVGSVSFAELLDAGELVASATCVEVVSADLTIEAVAANVTALRINGKQVEIGEAVQFRLSGQLAAADNDDGTGIYRLRVEATTDSAPARVLVRDVKIKAT